MTVRVRFAPSPTGHVHIGNIRAAIFNWLFARHHGGKFLLRIEDTDRERSTQEAIDALLDAMRWLKLDVDEEPLYQSAYRPQHQAAAEKLEAAGKAYRLGGNDGAGTAVCFRIPCEPELPACMRACGEVAVAPDAQTPVRVDSTGVAYAQVNRKGKVVEEKGCLAGFRGLRLFDASGACLFTLDEHREAILAGEAREFAGVTRMTYQRTEVVFHDGIKGELSKALDTMKDLVIVRSDGSPVFHLANVCDDITQGITHIIRGDDHVENTFRHVLLYHALGAPPPTYAHLPMIVNAQGKPYSKRDGDAYVGDFRAKGFHADAVFNYLTLLGWSPGDDREKLTREETVALFTLDRVKSAPAQMDLRKWMHLNQQYLAEMPFEQFVAAVRDTVREETWAGDIDENYFAKVAALLQTRTEVFAQAADWKYFFADDIAYDEKAVRKNLKREGVKEALAAVWERFSDIAFTQVEIEAAIHAVETERGIAEGKLNLPLRVAVTGVSRGAGNYETIELLGRERVLRRIDHAVETLCG